MKRFVSVICMVVGVAALSACGGSSGSSATTVYERPATTEPPASAAGTLLGGSLQGVSLAATFSNVSTVAGKAATFGHAEQADFLAAGATFYQPNGITTDGPNLYIADYKNHTIRKIVKATGQVSTLAGIAEVPGYANGALGTSQFYFPNAITTDGISLYVTDANFTVRKIDLATNTVSKLAGQEGSPGSIDETGAAAKFNQLNGITIAGNYLYVTDSNNTIRWIHKDTGVVRTLAGTPGSLGSVGGTLGAARFNNPTHITCDGPNLYVCDFFNRTVRKIVIATGEVSTIAGKEGTAPSTNDDQPVAVGTDARFNQPNGITTDGKNLYVTDSYNNTIRRISLTSPYGVDKIAGITFDQLKYNTPQQKSPGHVNTAGGIPSFDTPIGITTDGINLFVADSLNHLIRIIRP